MIFDSVRHGSPVPESFYPSNNGISGGEDETMKDISRKRRELRRVKLLGRAKPAGHPVISPDCDAGLRNKRWKCDDTVSILIPEDLIDRVPRNDVDLSGESTLSTCRAHGSASVIGRRRAMEDEVAVELGFLTRCAKTYDFFGVYDGHGGFRVAQSCRETLHKLVAKIVEEEGGKEIDWGKVMDASFREMDEEVNKNGAAVAMVGATAVVAVVGEEQVVVAHCGDSRAVLSRGGVAVQLSDDHKPDRPDELERIVGCGGKVIDWNGSQRVLGVLATSRSIGDRCLKPFVTPEPEVKVVNITDLDEFLILASDGLWDVVSNDLACQVVRKCLDGRIKRTSRVSVVQQDIELDHVDKTKKENHAAAAVLVELAMTRGSSDNISVIVVDLRHSKSGRVDSFSARVNI